MPLYNERSVQESIARRAGGQRPDPHTGNGAATVTPAGAGITAKTEQPDIVNDMLPRFEEVVMPRNAVSGSQRGVHISNIMQLEPGSKKAYIAPLGSLDGKKAKANFANMAATARMEIADEQNIDKGDIEFAVRCFELRGQRVIGVWRVK